MIAIDTNILVYAHREDSSWHEAADRCVGGAAESGAPWAIPWPCIHEFLAIVTHPRIYDPPTPLDRALEQVACWLEMPTLVMLSETAQHWPALRALLEARGQRTADARCPDRVALPPARRQRALDGRSRLRALCRAEVQESAGRGGVIGHLRTDPGRRER